VSLGFLVDTSVLSVLAPDRPALAAEQGEWLRARTDHLFISAVTVLEVEQGIGKLRRLGAAARADRFAAWLDNLLTLYGDRMLPLDARVARLAGALSDQAFASGRHPGLADIAIAATALAHDLIVLTENGKHFERFGVTFSDLAGAVRLR